MEITRINMEYKNDEEVKADFSITFNNCVTVNFCQLIEKNKRDRTIVFPNIKENEKLICLFDPIAKELEDEICNKILKLYKSKKREYVNEKSMDVCEITDFRCKLVNADEQIFEVEIVLNNSIKIRKILMQKENDNYHCWYSLAKTIDDKKVSVVSFDTSELENKLIQCFSNLLSKVYDVEKFATSDFKTPEERREKSNTKIKSQGIVCHEKLRLRESSNDVSIKDIDTICKKALASFFAIQVACDIHNGKYQEAIECFSKFLEEFEVKEYLNEKEKRIFNGTFSRQDAIDIDWEYETYWSIIWALGLIKEDISDANEICDCDKAIDCVYCSRDYEDFRAKCHMRNKEEILDMLDLYFRYDWAVTEKRVNPEVSIGMLNPSVVLERRRGLEWLISDQEDWYNLDLNT